MRIGMMWWMWRTSPGDNWTWMTWKPPWLNRPTWQTPQRGHSKEGNTHPPPRATAVGAWSLEGKNYHHLWGLSEWSRPPRRSPPANHTRGEPPTTKALAQDFINDLDSYAQCNRCFKKYTFPREWRDEIVQAQGTISDESLSSLSSGSDTLDSIDTDSDNEKTSGQALIGKWGSLPVL